MRVFLIFALVSSLIYSAPSHKSKRKPSSQPVDATSLKKGIERILGKARNLDFGIVVESLSQGDTIYEKNGDLKLVPASVNKVFTAYTALKKLKPNAVFKTSV